MASGASNGYSNIQSLWKASVSLRSHESVIQNHTTEHIAIQIKMIMDTGSAIYYTY